MLVEVIQDILQASAVCSEMLPKFDIAENAKYRMGIFMLNIQVKQIQEGNGNVMVLFECYHGLTNKVQKCSEHS